MIGNGGRRGGGPVVFEKRVADRNALIADISPGIVARRRDQLGDGVLRFMAERTAQNLFRTRSVFHSALLLNFPTIAPGWQPRQYREEPTGAESRSYIHLVL